MTYFPPPRKPLRLVHSPVPCSFIVMCFQGLFSSIVLWFTGTCALFRFFQIVLTHFQSMNPFYPPHSIAFTAPPLSLCPPFLPPFLFLQGLTISPSVALSSWFSLLPSSEIGTCPANTVFFLWVFFFFLALHYLGVDDLLTSDMLSHDSFLLV